MKLYLIRHGKAESSSESGRDFDRALAEKGIKQSEELGKYLSQTPFASDLILWCSDALRTKETLASMRTSVKLPKAIYSKELYLCSQDNLIQKIWAQDHNIDLMIIGHNFGISELAEYFSDEYNELRTGEYMCIEFDLGSWEEASRATGTIVDHFRFENP